MNEEALGNGDARLHWHLFPRRAGDAPEQEPVLWLSREEMWGEAFRPAPEKLVALKEQLRRALNKLYRRS